MEDSIGFHISECFPVDPAFRIEKMDENWFRVELPINERKQERPDDESVFSVPGSTVYGYMTPGYIRNIRVHVFRIDSLGEPEKNLSFWNFRFFRCRIEILDGPDGRTCHGSMNSITFDREGDREY